MQCTTRISMLCCCILLSYIHYWNQLDKLKITAWHIDRWKSCLCSWTNVLYILMWQSELPSKPRDGATCPLECAKHWLSAKNGHRCKKKILSCSAFVTGILSWLWLVDVSCNIADLNLVNRSVSWWAIGLFLYIFIQTEDAFQTVSRRFMVTCPFCLH